MRRLKEKNSFSSWFSKRCILCWILINALNKFFLTCLVFKHLSCDTSNLKEYINSFLFYHQNLYLTIWQELHFSRVTQNKAAGQKVISLLQIMFSLLCTPYYIYYVIFCIILNITPDPKLPKPNHN